MSRCLLWDHCRICSSAYTSAPVEAYCQLESRTSAQKSGLELWAGNSALRAFIYSRMARPRPNFVRTVCAGAFLIAGIVCAPVLHAQAPPGPIQTSPTAQPPPPPPRVPVRQKEEQAARKDIQGFWKLNRDQSDDARRKMQEARTNRRGNGPNGQPGGYPGGGYPGGGYPGGPFPNPGGGNGPYGGPRQRGDDGEVDARMLTLLPPDSLNVAKQDTEVDLTDDKYRKLIFYTDGRKIEKSKDDRVQNAAAHWENDHLVSDEKSPQGGKMSRTFELSSDGRQLEETLRIDEPRSNSPLVIRYVFDAAKAD